MSGSVAQVILDTRLPQLDKVLDYAVAAEQQDLIAPGVRVRVPVRGSRLTAGYVVSLSESSEFAGRLQSIERVISPVPVLRPEVLAVARAVAKRAAGNLSDVLRLAIPPRQARQETGDGWPEWRETGERATGHRHTTEFASGVIQLANGETVGAWAVQLAAAVAERVADGQQAIVALPDFRDQRQLALALQQVLPEEQIAQLDARQAAKDRYRAFLRTVRGGPLAIIGPRSTVFAPAADLGLIVVVDDGDPLHAEPLAPHVHTRDAALVRHDLSGADLLFAAHSRSSAVQRLVDIGYVAANDLPAPQGVQARPKVLTTEHSGGGDHRIPSLAFRAIQEGLSLGPVLVQVAKPGTHTLIVCERCRTAARCVECHGPLNARSRALTCSWCGRTQPPFRCSGCDGTVTTRVGSGSQKTAAELGRAFPGHAVTVADGDHEIFTVDDRKRLVVATVGAAPIAQGGYRSVVLLDGDSLLAGERLSVTEDYVRQSRTVLALARHDARCVITGATGAVASAVQTSSTAAFAAREVQERASLRFPPAVRVATVTGDHVLVKHAVEALHEVPMVDTLGTVDVTGPDGEQEVRTIVRFAFSSGQQVADELRAQVLRAATKSRARTGRLRVRMDDLTPFEAGA